MIVAYLVSDLEVDLLGFYSM